MMDAWPRSDPPQEQVCAVSQGTLTLVLVAEKPVVLEFVVGEEGVRAEVLLYIIIWGRGATSVINKVRDAKERRQTETVFDS